MKKRKMTIPKREGVMKKRKMTMPKREGVMKKRQIRIPKREGIMKKRKITIPKRKGIMKEKMGGRKQIVVATPLSIQEDDDHDTTQNNNKDGTRDKNSSDVSGNHQIKQAINKEKKRGKWEEEEQLKENEEGPKLDDGFYEIEGLRGKRMRKGQVQYLIKWRGWPETSNTWEPLEHLELCYDVVDAFEKSLQPGKHGKGKCGYGTAHSQPNNSSASGSAEIRCDEPRSSVHPNAFTVQGTQISSQSQPNKKSLQHSSSKSNTKASEMRSIDKPKSVSPISLSALEAPIVQHHLVYNEGVNSLDVDYQVQNASNEVISIASELVNGRRENDPKLSEQKADGKKLTGSSCRAVEKRKSSPMRILKGPSTLNELEDGDSAQNVPIGSGSSYGILEKMASSTPGLGSCNRIENVETQNEGIPDVHEQMNSGRDNDPNLTEQQADCKKLTESSCTAARRRKTRPMRSLKDLYSVPKVPVGSKSTCSVLEKMASSTRGLESSNKIENVSGNEGIGGASRQMNRGREDDPKLCELKDDGKTLTESPCKEGKKWKSHTMRLRTLSTLTELEGGDSVPKVPVVSSGSSCSILGKMPSLTPGLECPNKMENIDVHNEVIAGVCEQLNGGQEDDPKFSDLKTDGKKTKSTCRVEKKRKCQPVRSLKDVLTMHEFEDGDSAPKVPVASGSSCGILKKMASSTPGLESSNKMGYVCASGIEPKITEIIKFIKATASITDADEDFAVSFMAKRADGTEVVIDNKYLKQHNPLLLANFYERHLVHDYSQSSLSHDQ